MLRAPTPKAGASKNLRSILNRERYSKYGQAGDDGFFLSPLLRYGGIGGENATAALAPTRIQATKVSQKKT